MNINIKLLKSLPLFYFTYKKAFQKMVLGCVILLGLQLPLSAQEIKYSDPSWWFGVAGGANLNFYDGSTQRLNAALIAPVPFHKGFGAGLFLAPLVEYYRPGSMFGMMFQVGYDGRSSKFDQVKSPCNCPRDLSTKLTYLTIEPSLRFAPFRNDFYLFGGPRLAFNLDKSFTYKQGINPDIPEQIAEADIKGDLDNVNSILLSMQVGAGYDIWLTQEYKKTQFILSPFVSFHPYFGQSPRSTETWTVTTARVGVALKLGRGKKIEQPPVTEIQPKIKLSVSTPKNEDQVTLVRETFPIRNYIFFDENSTEISGRYTLIEKSEVANFKENQLDEIKSKNLSGRSSRQMSVYYNVINILGDRMIKNPGASVTLVGSSEKGPSDGLLMSKSVKKYLVEVFGINETRIKTDGRDKPKIPSEQPGGEKELILLREGDRRVSIESNSPELLMEFRSGPEAPLRPIEIVTINATIDSNFSCSMDGVNCTSWSLEVKDDKGDVQLYGPYYEQKVIIPNNTILGSRDEGDYNITMIGKTLSGKTITTDTTIHISRWKTPKVDEVMRYSILYEFNDAKAIQLYEKYLTDIVVPKIPFGAFVKINGYTDVIGEEDYNKGLSLARANDVKSIIDAALLKIGRNDVKIEVAGNGEDQQLSPFENNSPEERFYNRTVIIDIISRK